MSDYLSAIALPVCSMVALGSGMELIRLCMVEDWPKARNNVFRMTAVLNWSVSSFAIAVLYLRVSSLQSEVDYYCRNVVRYQKLLLKESEEFHENVLREIRKE